jgi:hypothetical protein
VLEVRGGTSGDDSIQTMKEKIMKTLAGLWMDHREAVIVLRSENGRETNQNEV